MNAQVRPIRLRISVFLFFVLAGLTACGGKIAPPTPYLAPTPPGNPILPVPAQATSLAAGPTSTAACSDSLLFMQDLTVPDNTVVPAGSSLDKQWQVQNNGTCNWDSHYRLRYIGGDPLGAQTEQALFPARSGTLVVIKMTFTAPTAPGNYYSEWQAYDPLGYSFGDSFFIKIVVGP
jgi:hypothetical protein